VDELVVDEAHRGQGIGRALLEHLAVLAGRHGCRRLELDSGLHRREAHAFYLAQGFEQRAALFTRKI
jgi:GNAT superfamily N-acetyltransferase